MFCVLTNRPVIRVYERNKPFFEFAHAQINYTDYYDMGSFMTFLDPLDNSLLIKQEDFFSIYAV